MPENHENRPPTGQPTDQLTGKFKNTVLAAAAVELIIYWILVIRFPAVMLPVSILLGGAAWFFRRTDNYLGNSRDEMQLSARDIELVDKYCKVWVYISGYGVLFAIFLLLRG